MDNGIVTGDDDGLSVFLENLHNIHKLFRELRIEVGRRLICNDDLGIIDQGPHNRHSLGLPS